MSSGSSGSSLDPPPLPPADYTPISAEAWSKQRMPPLKGVIIDPEYPPTREEALQALAKHNRDFDDPSLPYKNNQNAQQKQAEEPPIDVYRKSGTSDILGRSPTTDEVVNEMPGGTRHTAGGEKMVDVGVVDAVKSVKLSDFKKVTQIPCFREAWLSGIGAGFAVGGTLWTLGKKRRSIFNGVVATTLVTSMALWEFCNYRMRRSKRNMRVVKETWEETRLGKKAEWEAFKARQINGTEKSKIEQQSSWRALWNTGQSKPRGREG